MGKPTGADDADKKVFSTLVCFLTWDKDAATNSPAAPTTGTLATRLIAQHRHDSTDNFCIDFGFSD